MSRPVERTAAVDVTWPELPEALRGLWKACVAAEQGNDVARALTANVVGVAPVAVREDLRATLDSLQRRTPCRAFVVLIDDKAPGNRATISAASRRHGKTRDIVLEEVELHVPPAEFDHVPGLIRPLLVNDLASHLYWCGPWQDDAPMFEALHDLCDHTTVDSRRLAEPARQLTALAVRQQRGERLTDLAWLRLRPWRRALAEAFERSGWRPDADPVVEIVHGALATAPALLLARWLESRLGARTQCRVGTESGAAPEVVRVRFDGAQIEVAAHERHLTVHVTTTAHCFLPFHVPTSRGSDGDLLAAAIDIG